jgi:hypothetical protein
VPLRAAAERLETYREFWGAGFDHMDERLRSGEDAAGDG